MPDLTKKSLIVSNEQTVYYVKLVNDINSRMDCFSFICFVLTMQMSVVIKTKIKAIEYRVLY